MQKLLVIDKDLTLIRPASGATFVQHPEDQVLIEGVADAIDRYYKAGWAIVITSNQDGCDLSIVLGRKVPVGAYIPIDGQDYKITGIRKDENMDDPMLHFQLDRSRNNGKQYYSAYPDSRMAIRYKTIEDAIEEMRYCMKLLPQIDCAYFCPDFDGLQCYRCYGPQRSNQVILDKTSNDRPLGDIKSFRKPQPGMIQWAVQNYSPMFKPCQDVLFVGDRTEDQQCAESANVRFLSANEWLRSNP